LQKKNLEILCAADANPVTKRHSPTSSWARHERGVGRGEIITKRSIRMAWFALLLAGFLEIIWALGLKYSDGFTRFWPSVATGVAIVLSFGLLSVSLKTVPFGTAYAVWTGIGAAGAAITGILLFGESAGAARVGCLVLIVAGTVGLKLATPS
jgi:quaternary ammonium compound-resistance protein SugE